MTRFLRSMGWAAVCLICALPAHGGSLRQLRASAESSMLVTGSLVVNPDGRLRSYQINNADKIPQVVLDLISKSAADWRFKPVMRDGRAVAAKASMSLRIVAQPVQNGGYKIGIHGAQFGSAPGGYAGLSYPAGHKEPTQIHYPMEAMRARVNAYVYLALRVDREGKVTDTAVTQVNLTAIGPTPVMDRLRKMFADASTDACKHWIFNVAKGATPPGGFWTVRVPIDFWLGTPEQPKRSDKLAWDVYIPGPVHSIPWLKHDALASSDVDAMPSDGLYDPEQALTLVSESGAR